MVTQDWFIFAVAAVVGLCYLGVYLLKQLRKKKDEEEFLQRYPDAVKLYYLAKDKRQTLEVPKVDGERPLTFKVKKDCGIYLVPGAVRKLNLICEVGAPGGNSKTVHTAVMERMVESQKNYGLEFDSEKGSFLLYPKQ